MTRSVRALARRFAVPALASLLAACTHAAAPTATGGDANAPAVDTATARFGTLVTHVHAQGRVGVPAGGDAKLSFASSGIVAAVDVHVGEAVVAGQPLARLDQSGLAIEARQAREDAAAAAASYGGGGVPAQAVASAQRRLTVARNRLAALLAGTSTANGDATVARDALRQAEAKVAGDRRALDRQSALYAGGVAAQKDVEAARQQLALDQADLDAARSKAATATGGISGALIQARADVAQAQSDVRSAQAQTGVTAAQAASAQARYAAAQRTLANAVLRAPVSGTVTQILKHAGEAVDPTQPAIVVGPPTSNVVSVTVAGDAARDVHRGAVAAVTVPSRGLHGRATVASIVPSVDPVTQTTTVLLSGAPAGSASGDAVDVVIDARPVRGVLIPTSAIVEDPQNGHTLVFVRVRAKAGDPPFVSRQVATGAADGALTVVTSGLRAGETIASDGAFDLLAPAGG